MGIGPNNRIFRGLSNISLNGVLFDSFDPLNFVHRYLYCTYENILCLHPLYYITSQASGRKTPPVILPTIIFVFLSTLLCKESPREIQLFKSSYLYSNLSCKVTIPRTSSISSVARFWDSRLSVVVISFCLWHTLGRAGYPSPFCCQRKEGLDAITKVY